MHTLTEHPTGPLKYQCLLPDRGTQDPDLLLHSEFFNCRQNFLALCQGNHYQFDQLRRAKHSTMMILYHMHNPSAPSFVHACNNCHTDITTGMRWQCTVCTDFDLCDDCNKKLEHPHKLQAHAVTGGGNLPTDENARQQRQLAIQMHLHLLVHASECPVPAGGQCNYSNCQKMKQLLAHSVQCQTRKRHGNCGICRRIWGLIQIHARQCHKSKCRVQGCSAVKRHLRVVQQRNASRRRSAYIRGRQRRPTHPSGGKPNASMPSGPAAVGGKSRPGGKATSGQHYAQPTGPKTVPPSSAVPTVPFAHVKQMPKPNP